MSNNDFDFIQLCPHCERKFKVITQDQTPGFRFLEKLICPYCDKLIIESLEFEFYTKKMDDE